MGIIEGETASDAQKEKQNLNTTFKDSKFDKLRSLITVGRNGKTFNKIGADALTGALKGVTLSDKEQALVNQVTTTINSKEVHKVEFVAATGNYLLTDQKLLLTTLMANNLEMMRELTC